MKIRYLLLFVLAGLLAYCTPPPKATQTETIQLPDGTAVTKEALDAFIQKEMDSMGMPGLSIALINNEKVVYKRSFGLANTESSTPVDERTLFEAASLSKPLFAYFTLKMVQRGLISLDTPLYRYLPHPGIDSASQEDYKLVTARLVLCHATGFPNWSQGKPIHLAFKPGHGFSYSGEAYQYLAAVLGTRLQVGWGKGLDSVFRKTVALPLDMEHSYYTWNKDIATHKARGHQGGVQSEQVNHAKAFGAAHSLHTNAGDYAKFLIEMMQDHHLPNALMQEMLTTQNNFTADNPLREVGQTGWTLGWAVRPTDHGLRLMHTGNNHDFQSYACFYQNSGYGLVLFTNSDLIEPFYAKLGAFLHDKF